MIFRLFHRRSARATIDSLYGRIVAASLRPDLYARLGVADTVEGRLESLILHVVLVLRRLRRLPPPADAVAQDLVDACFRHLDASLRELGVGDMKVPRRMKELAGGFYGRAAAYDAALDRSDMDALSSAIERNFEAAPATAAALARYCHHAETALAGLSLERLLGEADLFPSWQASECKP